MNVESLRDTVTSLLTEADADVAELGVFRSVADPAVAPSDGCAMAGDWLADRLRSVGLSDVTILSTMDGGRYVCGHAPGPDGTPTVLLYCHHGVQPPLGEDDWAEPVWELTEHRGRWYGRGTAGDDDEIVIHLTALRALRKHDGGFPCTIKLVCEVSAELGGGLAELMPDHADLLRADAIVLADTGNVAVGVPTVTTTLRGLALVDVTLSALSAAAPDGPFGGSHPDPVVGLIRLLATLHDERGNTTVGGLDVPWMWPGADDPAAYFRPDAHLLNGVRRTGDGMVADLLWARPSATVLGIDVRRAAATAQPAATARISLRVSPGTTACHAQDALVAHLTARVPRGLRCVIDRVATGDPIVGTFDGPAFAAMGLAMEAAFDNPMTTESQGGSVRLCNVLAAVNPDAEIILRGIAGPTCRGHACDEDVDPAGIGCTALAEALFLRTYGRRD